MCPKCGGELKLRWKSAEHEMVSCLDCWCWYDLKEMKCYHYCIDGPHVWEHGPEKSCLVAVEGWVAPCPLHGGNPYGCAA